MKVDSTTNSLVQAVLMSDDVQLKQYALRLFNGETRIQDASMSPKYLTLKQVADAIGVHASTCWRWRLPGATLGSRKKYILHEVEEYLNSETFKLRLDQLRRERRISSRRMADKI